MKKIYIITFSLSVLVTFALCVVAYMLMLPQVNVTVGDISKYEAIAREDYKYVKTKDISKDFLEKDYTITVTQINSFLNKGQYKPGNTDPFTQKSNSGSSNGGKDNVNNSTNNNTNNSGTGNNNSTGQVKPSVPSK